MPRGCTKPLYILPFDHRGSFVSKLFGWKGALSAEQSAQVSVTKLVAYDGFEAAVAGVIDKGQAGILLDEHFGPDILRAARSGGIITCAPVEKSGQDEFDFEFGEDFAADVDALAPTLCKVLVRYNPEGDAALNQRQSHRLRRLSDFLSNEPPKFMLELLMPAKSSQLDAVAGNSQAYDRKLRPALMLRVICELQDTGVDPDVWKVEGLDSRDDCERIMATARHDGRANVGCIVLGRGENKQHVRAWLAIAAGVPGFVGFAVGRTTFWEPLIGLRDGKIDRAAAVTEIAKRCCNCVDIFETARAAAGASVTHG